MYAVILCGGSGTRLWPLSRSLYPKQFLNLLGSHSLLQETVLRLNGVWTFDTLIVSNEAHRFTVFDQLKQIDFDPKAILLEPEPKNTAPAIALAAHFALTESNDPEPLLVVFPADHFIEDITEFNSVLGDAVDLARNGYLVTFGVTPSLPETGYGYIQSGSKITSRTAYTIERFIEKPDQDTANSLYKKDKFYWNSGIYLFSAAAYISELKKFAPEIVEQCKLAVASGDRDGKFLHIPIEHFGKSPSDSIDYALMEKTSRSVVVPVDMKWNDVGSWSSVFNLSEKDERGNNIIGDVLVDDEVDNCFLFSNDRLLAAVGVQDLIIVETKDAVLVANKNTSQNIKNIVNQLTLMERDEAVNHRKVFRPWGSFETMVYGDRFQVKQIIVNSGAKLSLQRHHHRAEHWVVVSGTAKITKGEDEFILTEDQSTYIFLGEMHRLENPGKIPLVLIEVQTGSYLGEDDIVRLGDEYGRMTK